MQSKDKHWHIWVGAVFDLLLTHTHQIIKGSLTADTKHHNIHKLTYREEVLSDRKPKKRNITYLSWHSFDLALTHIAPNYKGSSTADDTRLQTVLEVNTEGSLCNWQTKKIQSPIWVDAVFDISLTHTHQTIKDHQ